MEPNALALNPSDGQLYYFNRATYPETLYRVDPKLTSPTVSLVGQFTNTSPAYLVGASFNASGALLTYWSNATISIANIGSRTFGAFLPITGSDIDTSGTNGDIAFDSTGRLHVVSNTTSGTSALYRLVLNSANTAFIATKIVTITGTSSASINGLAIDPVTNRFYISVNDSLYGLDALSNPSGAATLKGNSIGVTDLGSCSVIPDTPTLTKSFTPALIQAPATTSTLTIKVGNSNLAPYYLYSNLVDTMPAGMTVATGSLGGTCASSANPLTATNTSITLAVGAIIPVGGCTITATVKVPGTGGQYTNTVTANTLQASTGTLTAPASATLTVQAAATVSKAFSPTTVLLNGTSTVTFTLNNPNPTGNPALTNLNFTDTLTGMSAASNVIGGTCAATSSPVLAEGATSLNLTVPTLAAGASCTVTVTVKGTQVGVHANTASGVSSTETPTPGAQSNTVNLTVTAADVGVTKTGPLYAKPATDVTYTLTVTNSGSAAAETVTLSDTLPVGLTYVSSSPAATVSGQTLTWTLGTLVTGGSRTITVTVKAPSEDTLIGTAVARKLTNTASVSSSTVETASANNTSSITTEMIAAKLTKSVQNVTQKSAVGTAVGGLPDDVLEYCIAFQNIGGVALPNFLLTDDVPGNTAAQTNGYDQEPTAAPGSGVKLTRSATTYLTSSAADTDAGSLSTTAGQYGQGILRVTLGSLAVGEQGSACFRTVIR